jgi:hypothetical protein
MDLQSLEQEVKDDSRKVAGWLLNYPERRRDYESRRMAILQSSPPKIPKTVKGTKFGDPTGRKGQRLGDLDWKWIKLVEDVEARLPDKMRIILQLRRETPPQANLKGRPAWISYARHRYARIMSEKEKKPVQDFWIESPHTFSEWWNKIVHFAVILAAKRGLLDDPDG